MEPLSKDTGAARNDNNWGKLVDVKQTVWRRFFLMSFSTKPGTMNSLHNTLTTYKPQSETKPVPYKYISP